MNFSAHILIIGKNDDEFLDIDSCSYGRMSGIFYRQVGIIQLPLDGRLNWVQLKFNLEFNHKYSFTAIQWGSFLNDSFYSHYYIYATNFPDA